MLIVPRAQIASSKPCSGHKFTGEDQTGVDQTAEYEVMTAHKAYKRRQQGSESVDGKHPYGCSTRQAQVSFAESVEGCENQFQKPPQQAAMNIVVNKFFHNSRMSGCEGIYTGN